MSRLLGEGQKERTCCYNPTSPTGAEGIVNEIALLTSVSHSRGTDRGQKAGQRSSQRLRQGREEGLFSWADDR